MITHVEKDGVRYALSILHRPSEQLPRYPQDEMRVYVVRVAEVGADEDAPAWLVRCSIEPQSWYAARKLKPDDDALAEQALLDFYGVMIEQRLPDILTKPVGSTYYNLHLDFATYYPAWEQHLKG